MIERQHLSDEEKRVADLSNFWTTIAVRLKIVLLS